MIASPARPRNLLLAALAAAAVLAAIAAGASPASADPALDGEEQAFLDLLNAYRAQNGRGALAAHWDLNEAADWYATDMATKNYFGNAQYCGQTFGVYQAHCDSLGRWPKERVGAFGYPQGVGENSAAGFSSAQAVLDAWKGSPGHNANMLGSYASIGIGRACASGAKYGCYWVTDFGYLGPPAGTPTPVPTPDPTPVPTPSPTPQPLGLTWDDFDCDGRLDPADGMVALMAESGFEAQGGGCPATGSYVTVAGSVRVWGDFDCSGQVTATDTILWLHLWANLPAQFADPTCPAPGTWF